jgi:hypothetical protein
MITQVGHRFPEQRAIILFLQGRGGVFARPRRFEGIAARLNFSFDVARLAAGSAQVLELVIIGFELLVSDPPILDRHTKSIDELLAVPLLHRRLQHKVLLLEAEGLPVPVDPGSTQVSARQEGSPATDR